MKRQEMQKILMTIQAAYPNYKPENKTVAVDTWFTMLGEHDYNAVSGAVQAFILTDTKGFAPSIGQIVEKLQTTTRPLEMNELEAWDHVAKAIRNSNYHSEEEYAKLPPTVQEAVSPGQLAAWAKLDSDQVHTVAQSNFMRTYRATVARQKEWHKLPPALRQITESITAKIEDHEEEKEEQREVSPMPEWAKKRIEEMFA